MIIVTRKDREAAAELLTEAEAAWIKVGVIEEDDGVPITDEEREIGDRLISRGILDYDNLTPLGQIVYGAYIASQKRSRG